MVLIYTVILCNIALYEYDLKDKSKTPEAYMLWCIPLEDVHSSQKVFLGSLFCFQPLPIGSSFPKLMRHLQFQGSVKVCK